MSAARRASTILPGATPAVAAATFAVTSSVDTSTETASSWHFSSFSRLPARKPAATRSLPSEEFCAMQSSAQWWFVSTRPSAEMKEPVQPLSSRTVARCTRSSQAESSVTPYFEAMASRGGLSKVHMPSSATADRDARAAMAATGMRFIRGLPCVRGPQGCGNAGILPGGRHPRTGRVTARRAGRAIHRAGSPAAAAAAPAPGRDRGRARPGRSPSRDRTAA